MSVPVRRRELLLLSGGPVSVSYQRHRREVRPRRPCRARSRVDAGASPHPRRLERPALAWRENDLSHGVEITRRRHRGGVVSDTVNMDAETFLQYVRLRSASCLDLSHGEADGLLRLLDERTRERDEARRELEEVKAERDHWKSVQAFRWQQLTEIVGPLGEHDNSPYDTAARKLARLAAAERVVDGLREVHAIMDDRSVLGKTDDEMIAHNQELQAKWTELHALRTAYDTAK